MDQLSEFEEQVADILKLKLEARGIDPADDDLSFEQIAEIEELTKESQDEARENS